jgi:hypothetical protein
VWQLISLIFRKRNCGGAVIVVGEFYDSEFVAEVNSGVVACAIGRISRVVKILVICVIAHFAASPLKLR